MNKKILFLLPSLNHGGTEKVMVNIFNHLNRKLFDPYFCAFTSGTLKCKIADSEKIIILSHKRVLFGIFKLMYVIHRTNPKIIFSSQSHLNAIVCVLKRLKLINSYLVIRESNYLSEQQNNATRLYEKYFVTWIIRIFYPYADHLICQTNEMKKDILSFFPSWDVPTSVIYNPIDHPPPFITESPKKRIISVGRLEKQKNHLLLIEAFNIIKNDVPHNLIIIGEGSERKNIELLIAEKGLQNRINLTGHLNLVWEEYKNSALLVLTSNFEGFPNVIIEAMANSTPVIASDCPSGPNEIIEHGNNGFLFPVGCSIKLAELMKLLLLSSKYSKDMAYRSYMTLEKYNISKIIKRYEQILYNNNNNIN